MAKNFILFDDFSLFYVFRRPSVGVGACLLA